MTYEYVLLKKLMLGDLELFPDARPEFFSKKNGQIYKLLLQYFDKTRALPDAQMLKAEITAKAPVAVREGYLAIVDGIMNSPVAISNADLVDALEEGVTLRNVNDKIEDLLEAQRDKDAKRVKEIVGTIQEKLSLDSVKIKDSEEAFNEADGFSVVPSGFGDTWDQSIGGGLSGLVLFGALSGGLKSVALQSTAVATYQSGQSVLFLSLELSGRVLGNRIKAQISGVDFGKINTGTCTPDEQKLVQSEYDAVFKGNDQKFRVVTDALDTDDLINIINVEHQLHGTKVVVIDYINLVSPGKRDSGEGWKVLSDPVKKLHKLTMKLGITIVSATQVNVAKKATESEPPDITTRGSQELLFSATQFFYLHQVESQESEEDIQIMFTMKNRLAQAKHTIFMAQAHIMRLSSTDVMVN